LGQRLHSDDTSDLLWRSNVTRATEPWLMQQGARTGDFAVGNLSSYQLLAASDINHDGTDDLIGETYPAVRPRSG
jgi:hypothetical protein